MDGMSTEGKAYRVFKMLNTALMILFTLNTVFLPVDNFELKILSLLALLVVNANVILLPKTQDERIVFVFGFLLTTMNILFSVLWTKELVSNIRIGYCGYILLLYSIIKKYKIDFARIITVVLFLLADFMLLMAFLDLSGILAFENNPILMWLYQTGNAMVGKGAHLPIYYAIFMKTSPMLLLVIPYCIKSKKWIHTVICTAALVISGTRADIFMAMLVLLLCILLCLRGRLFRNIRNRFRCDTKIPLRYILCAWVGGTVVI